MVLHHQRVGQLEAEPRARGGRRRPSSPIISQRARPRQVAAKSRGQAARPVAELIRDDIGDALPQQRRVQLH